MRASFVMAALLSCSLYCSSAIAQVPDDEDATESMPPADDMAPAFKNVTLKRWYVSNATEAGIFSTSFYTTPTTNQQLSTLRFSYFLNIGLRFNYNYDEHFGIFTGLGIKNIGFIVKNGDSTIKRRVFAIGAPIGVKIGNLEKQNYAILGGGLDLPFNYREKAFTDRRDKKKFNEFFSERTPTVMPYLFVGGVFAPGISLTAQYYPLNFFNEDYTETVGGVTTQPYRGYDCRLINLCVGINIQYSKKKKTYTTEEAPGEMMEEDDDKDIQLKSPAMMEPR